MRRLPAIALLLSAAPAMAASSLGYGNGGRFARFDPIVDYHNRTGEPFRIEGHCQSSCTLFLAIRNVCIDPGAELLFHAGHDRSRNITAAATQHLMNAYNARLRAYLVANHAMDTWAFQAFPEGI
jgi:hypothetical protein